VDQTTSNLQSTATTTVDQTVGTVRNTAGTSSTSDPLKTLGVNLG
jgi:hypothetical protein